MARVHYLEDRIPWFGKFNGYEQLTRYVPPTTVQHVFAALPGVLPRLLGKWHSLRHGLGTAPQAQVDALRRFAGALARHRSAVGHVLYGEHFLPYLKSMSAEGLARTTVTFHQPFGHWSSDALTELARVRHAIFMFTPPPNTFDAHLCQRPTMILHGVDTGFFTPTEGLVCARVLYSGVHLRNLGMLERVVERLLRRNPAIAVDMLVPLAHRHKDVFTRLARHERLVWHADLDEIQLRDLYHRSAVMLLPMQDSGANTAVIEALACGLPVVTTDVGGIRDYGGGTVVSVVPNDDDEAMAGAVEHLIDDPVHHRAVAQASRRFAEDHLAWGKVVPQHLAVYLTLGEGGS